MGIKLSENNCANYIYVKNMTSSKLSGIFSHLDLVNLNLEFDYNLRQIQSSQIQRSFCERLLHLPLLNINIETWNSHTYTQTHSGPSSGWVTFRQIYKPPPDAQSQKIPAVQYWSTVTVTCLSTCRTDQGPVWPHSIMLTRYVHLFL